MPPLSKKDSFFNGYVITQKPTLKTHLTDYIKIKKICKHYFVIKYINLQNNFIIVLSDGLLYNIGSNLCVEMILLKAKRLAVIGGGASGFAAAIETSINNPHINVTIFDRMPKACKKILVTGNGRCNYSNENLSPIHFYGDRKFLLQILTAAYADDENFFRELGVLTYHEDGRLYPKSQQATTIRDCLIKKVMQSGVNLVLDKQVESISKSGDGFLIQEEYFDAVIICTGGKASPAQGSDGSGYKLAENFGHSITPLYPALCGLTVSEKWLNTLKGVRCECNVKICCNNTPLGEEYGEVQFTDKGISGIPVMNLSHLCKDKENIKLELDLCQSISRDELLIHLKDCRRKSPMQETEYILNGIIHNKLGYVVMEKLKIKAHTPAGELKDSQITDIVNTIKCFTVKITGTRGFDNAQVTCGGINTEEIDPSTMMSRLQKGLFICGEILDVHGDCGGYNLHLAWITGRIAGKAAADYLG